MKLYNLRERDFSTDEYMYVYSPICKSYPVFKKEGDHLVNEYDEGIGDYEYISIVTKQKCASGTEVAVRCSFHKYGAPLIVFTDDIRDIESRDGVRRPHYGLHFEVVAWEEGCNVWHIVPFPERTERPIMPTKILAEAFKIQPGEVIDMKVRVEKKRIEIEINGHRFSVEHADIPESFHIGFTACEGINKLYDMTIAAK